MTSASSPRIAIVGGGIGGLSAAAFLHRADLRSTVYEQAAELRAVGAGVVVPPNAAGLLRRLGVMDGFLEHAVALEVGSEFRRWADGRVLSAEKLVGACERLYGEQTHTVHRADLLHAVVPDGTLELGRRCTAVSPTQPPTVAVEAHAGLENGS